MDNESYELATESQEWAFTKAMTELALKFTLFLIH